ncbi:MAG: hypothetical protein DRJ41_02030 [Thermoprotei archaeon]|nr:MAG: hypothetical protein DRJ41_02030 [Thermoprotei archaeon]
MNPRLAKGMLTSAFFILIMALMVLPFQSPSAAEFVPNLLAIVLSITFIIVVVYDVRKQISKR